jgi:hypothetical protein
MEDVLHINANAGKAKSKKQANANANAEDRHCYMFMPRIYRPDGRDEVYPHTVQAFLGSKNQDLLSKDRGQQLGLKQLKEMASLRSNSNSNSSSTSNKEQTARFFMKVAYELGKIMALIHYFAKHDAHDVELYMGKLYRGRRPRFFLADFDQSESIVEYDDEVIGRLVWSLDAVPYFPRPEVDKALYDRFRTGYLRVAKLAKMHDVAKKVLEEYAE